MLLVVAVQLAELVHEVVIDFFLLLKLLVNVVVLKEVVVELFIEFFKLILPNSFLVFLVVLEFAALVLHLLDLVVQAHDFVVELTDVLFVSLGLALSFGEDLLGLVELVFFENLGLGGDLLFIGLFNFDLAVLHGLVEPFLLGHEFVVELVDLVLLVVRPFKTHLLEQVRH